MTLVQSQIDALNEKIQENKDEIDEFKERWTALLDSDPIKHVTDIAWGNPNEQLLGGGWGARLVYIGGLWGSICFDGFDENAADFFCGNLNWWRSTSFEPISHNRVSSNITGLPVPVLLTNVKCNENATTIDDCTSGPMGYSNCASGEDVIVHCGLWPPADSN